MGIPWVWAFYESALSNNGLLDDPTTGGSVTYVDGKIGKAIDCSSSSVINFEDSDVLNNDHHTIAFWTNMTATTAGYQEFLLNSPDGTSSNRSPLLTQTTGNVPKFHFRYTDIGIGSGANAGLSDFGESTSVNFNLNQWYHIVLTKDGRTISLYVDGTFVESVDQATVYPSLAGQQLRIANGSPNIYLNDLRIYPNVLNKREIKELSAGLVYHAKLNGDSKDCSGYGAAATDTSVTYSMPDYVNDAVIHNQYVSMDQANDAGISLADSQIEKIKNLVNEEYSVSVWFRTAGYVLHGSVYNALFGLNDIVSDGFGFGVCFDSTEHLTFISTGQSTEYQTAFPLNQWNHLVAVKSSTDLTIYLNGTSVLSTAKTFTTQTAISSTFYIGKDGSSNNRNFTGDLSDLRIYATALSSDDVSYLYKNRANLSSDGNLKAQSIKLLPNTRGADHAEYFITDTQTYTFVAFEDNTPIYKNGVLQSTIASAYSTTTVACTLGDKVSSTKPFEARSPTYEALPTSWRGYKFLWSQTRDLNGVITMFAVDKAADYTIYQDGVSTFTGTVPAGSYATVTLTALAVNYIELTEPCCVYAEANAGSDTTCLFPMREELFGIPSSTLSIASDEAATYKIYESDGTLTTKSSISAHTATTQSGDVSYGAPSARIIVDSTQVFGAKAYGDGEGTNNTSFVSRDAMAHKFVLPETAEWVSFVGIKAGATVQIYNSSGTLVDTKAVTGGGTHSDGEILPTHVKFTTDGTYLNTVGWFYICSSPMAAFYQGTDDDERHLFGAKVRNEATYSKFELPNKGGVVSTESINEVGVDTDGLIFWSPLDNGPREISGYTPLSITYTGNGEPTRINNIVGDGAYRFVNTAGGTADYYINYASLPYTEINSSGEITACAWVKFDTSTPSERECFFSWQSAVFFTHATDDKFRFETYDDGNSIWRSVVTTTTYDAGIWYHVAATFDGTDLRIFINGSLQNTTTPTSLTFTSSASQNVRIGDATWSGEAFDGDISQCMIFSRALSEKEINTLYKMQSNSSAMQRLNDGTLIIRGISDTANG